MAVDLRVDCRATLGFVTDTPPAIFSGGSSDLTYPTVRGGVTCGWDPDFLGAVTSAADRNAGNPPELAGINFLGAGAASLFQADIPNGNYNVSLAIGDASGAIGRTQVDILDGSASVLFTVVQVSTTANSFTDAQGNEYTAATWTASQQSRSVTITQSLMRVKVTPFGGSSFPGLAYFAVSDAAAPDTRRFLLVAN